MDIGKKYSVLDNCAITGVKVPIGDSIWILAYYNSSIAQLCFHRKIEVLKSTLEPDEAVLVAMRETLAEKIVLGWENVTEDDILVKYSKDECKRLLDTYSGLDIELMSKSLEVEQYRKKQEKATLGN